MRAGYKQTEVGVIPEDWSVGLVGNSFEICNQLRLPISETVRKRMTGPYPYYGPTGVQGTINEYRVEGEHALIGEDGDHFLKWRSNPMTLLVRGKFNVNNHAHLVRGTKNITAWFYWYFANRDITQVLTRQGAGRYKLTNATLTHLPCALPPTRVEQEAIAEALSDADALIESLEQLLAKKRRIKQGAMQELLTGKRRLPRFSGEWQSKQLSELFTFSGGYSASRDQLSADGYCYLHYGDIHKSAKTFVDVGSEYQDIPKLNIALKRISSASLLENGDVVFVDASEDDAGTSKHVVVANTHNIPFISGLHTIVAKSKTDELVHEYRIHCFQTAAVRQQFLFYAVGTKVSGISKSNIGKIQLSVPGREEQTAIASILSDMDGDLDAISAKLAKARALKQGMMQELLTGRIRLV